MICSVSAFCLKVWFFYFQCATKKICLLLVFWMVKKIKEDGDLGGDIATELTAKGQIKVNSEIACFECVWFLQPKLMHLFAVGKKVWEEEKKGLTEKKHWEGSFRNFCRLKDKYLLESFFTSNSYWQRTVSQEMTKQRWQNKVLSVINL